METKGNVDVTAFFGRGDLPNFKYPPYMVLCDGTVVTIPPVVLDFEPPY